MSTIITAGNKGPGIRSDCFVTLELTASGGCKVDVTSKVKALYGASHLKLAKEMLAYYGIENASMTIEDSGALDFVLAARIEAVIRGGLGIDKEFLGDMLPSNDYSTKKDRFRHSRLYLPGNSPKLMLNAGIHDSDGIILDLEDSVAPTVKEEARLLVRNALRQVDFYGAERMVRINQLPLGLKDLDYLVPHNVHVILIPKCESAEQVKQVDGRIQEIRDQLGVPRTIYLMPIIESALGVVNAYQIASATENVAAIAIGLEDYTADLGAKRTNQGEESFYARSKVVNAARAAGIQPIDSVFSDVSDMEMLQNVVSKSRAMGFAGMGCIHPRQIKVVNNAFSPSSEEFEHAQRIVRAYDQATQLGLGVISLGSKMIDPPVVKRAQQTINLAIRFGKMPANWKENTIE